MMHTEFSTPCGPETKQIRTQNQTGCKRLRLSLRPSGLHLVLCLAVFQAGLDVADQGVHQTGGLSHLLPGLVIDRAQVPEQTRQMGQRTH